jgi:CspA family cold shock protein
VPRHTHDVFKRLCVIGIGGWLAAGCGGEPSPPAKSGSAAHAPAAVEDNRRMLPATVKSWSAEEGWGVLVSPEVDGDIWAHFSAVDGPGYRELVAGQNVLSAVEDLGGPVQDGYRFRATRVVSAR